MSQIRDILKIVKRAIKAALAEVHTHIPCQVISYDAATNTCAVQPCIKVLRSEDPNNTSAAQLPIIEDVPVKQFGSGKTLLSVAPQADSYGILHVSERAIENWMMQGGIQDPSSSIKFGISDGFFDPGIYPLMPDGDNGLLAVPINTDRIELRDRLGTTYVAVLNDGGIVEIDALTTIDIGGADAAGFAMISDKFDTRFKVHTHSTAFGPSGPPNEPFLPTDFSTKVKIG